MNKWGKQIMEAADHHAVAWATSKHRAIVEAVQNGRTKVVLLKEDEFDEHIRQGLLQALADGYCLERKELSSCLTVSRKDHLPEVTIQIGGLHLQLRNKQDSQKKSQPSG